MNDDKNNTQTVLIVGATGYIGNAVVAEAVQQGYDVITVTRSLKSDGRLDGTEVVVADVTDPASVAKAFSRHFVPGLPCRPGPGF